jgi:hypothetical protein
MKGVIKGQVNRKTCKHVRAEHDSACVQRMPGREKCYQSKSTVSRNWLTNTEKGSSLGESLSAAPRS